MSVNSNYSVVELALMLSVVVQMKNSLLQYLKVEQAEDLSTELASLSLQQEEEYYSEQWDQNRTEAALKDNLHLLIVTEDTNLFLHKIDLLRKKGVHVAMMPLVFDEEWFANFLLAHDH